MTQNYCRQGARRGVALLIVLGMLAMTLGLCFAMLRVQTTATNISQNQLRLGDARSAALTGLNIGLAKIHTNAWGGVNSTLTGNLGTGLSYSVQFIAGDSSLTPASPNYADLPYRVTIRSTGTAVHPGNAAVTSTHKMETVVQLIPRAMAAVPARWPAILNHTVYQWGGSQVNLEVPSRIVGPVYAQANMTLAPSYPTQDLRPFSGRIDEVAVFNKALNAGQILQIHQAALGGTSPDPVSQINSLGPVAYWRLNEPVNATVAADQAGANSGVYVGAKAGSTDVPFAAAGTSVYFDGMNDHLRCGRFDITTSAMTILCWFRPDSFPAGDQHLVAKGLGPLDADLTWMLGIANVSGIRRLKFGVRTSSGWKTVDDNGTSLPVGVWTFAAVVYSGSQLRLYRDGVLLNQLSQSGAIQGNTNAFVTIGDAPPGSPRTRLMRDYLAKHLAGQADHRPLTGPWRAPSGKINSETANLLSDDLAVATELIPSESGAPVTIPSNVPTYQMFPGGPLYSVPDPGALISNVNLVADPATNPLGLFKHTDNVEILNSVTIRGTLLVYDSGDLTVKGTAINWEPAALPVIDGESTPRRLPAAMVKSSIRIDQGAVAAQVKGAVVAGSDFETIERLDTSPGLTLNGRVVSKFFSFGKRANTTTSITDWRNYVRNFLLQSATPYFSDWLAANQNMNFAPLWTIQPDSSGQVDHWPDFTQPVFIVRSGDNGLRWKIVSWRDGL